MLLSSYTNDFVEAGCDEAGRGCLAGPVFAAAVILPKEYNHESLTDSKKLSHKQRERLRSEIEQDALSYAVCSLSHEVIDEMNVLKASLHCMNLAVVGLKERPELLLIDGNRFMNETKIDFVCIVKGDAKFLSIAAASILAKTHRDAYMERIHEEYPCYGWKQNKGYPTKAHFEAIRVHGLSPYHRKTFNTQRQLSLTF